MPYHTVRELWARGWRLKHTKTHTETGRQRHGLLVTGKKPFIQSHHGGLYTQQSSGPTGENLILWSSRQGTAFSNSNQKALAGKSSWRPGLQMVPTGDDYPSQRRSRHMHLWSHVFIRKSPRFCCFIYVDIISNLHSTHRRFWLGLSSGSSPTL